MKGKKIRYFAPGYIVSDAGPISADVFVMGQHGTKFNYVNTIDTNAETVIQTGDKVRFNYKNKVPSIIDQKYGFGHITVALKE